MNILRNDVFFSKKFHYFCIAFKNLVQAECGADLSEHCRGAAEIIQIKGLDTLSEFTECTEILKVGAKIQN